MRDRPETAVLGWGDLCFAAELMRVYIVALDVDSLPWIGTKSRSPHETANPAPEVAKSNRHLRYQGGRMSRKDIRMCHARAGAILSLLAVVFCPTNARGQKLISPGYQF